ncbi:MAG TPA: thrombospondin type 3 repeat-containing protein [Baekduia sp.]|nr:thrombospondin type 3 repeat-containing protein [Baekduia sp.]
MRLAAVLLALLLGAPALAGAHPTQPLDSDHDGVMNLQDICPDVFDARQTDTDGDGQPGAQRSPREGGDACDVDDDGDGVDDAIDGCPLLEDPEQRDTDADGVGDLCDLDDDADGVRDQDDACPKTADPDQADHDDDFIGDACDPDAPKGPRRATFVALGRHDPDDRVAPAVRVRAPRRVARDELRAGLPVAVRCSEACAAEAELRRGSRVVARADGAIAAAGETFLFVRLRRASAGAHVLRLVIRDASGNPVRRTVRLRVVR